MVWTAMIQTLSLAGAIISLYALYVKRRAERDTRYRPLCDIRANISCTRAFLSKEGPLTGFPNPLIGAIVYPLLFLLTIAYVPAIVPIVVAFAAASVYLAYVSYIKQKNFCLVCTAIYMINVALLVVSWNL